MACVFKGVFTGKPLAVFRDQPLGISESLKHQSMREQNVANVTGRQVSFTRHSSGPSDLLHSWLFGSLLGSENSFPLEILHILGTLWRRLSNASLSSGLFSDVTDTLPGNLLVSRFAGSHSLQTHSSAQLPGFTWHIAPRPEMPITCMFPLQSQSVWMDPLSTPLLSSQGAQLQHHRVCALSALSQRGGRPPLLAFPAWRELSAHTTSNFWLVSCF